MEEEVLHPLGKLGKPWGHQGELTLHLEGAEVDDIRAMGVLFVDLDGQHVPFFVSRIREHARTGAVVQFDELDRPQAVAFLVNREVFAPPGVLPAPSDAEDDDDDEPRPTEWLGLHVHDEEHGHLGEVAGMEGTEDNPVLVVVKDGQEVLLPVGGDLIRHIDLERGRIDVRTPEGLVELYRKG
jgi:16S rRNA processing protein RimM